MNEIKSLRNETEYSLLAKTFHWGFVILFVYGIYKQIDNINQLEDISLLKSEINLLRTSSKSTPILLASSVEIP